MDRQTLYLLLVVAVLALSGCIEVTVRHDLHRSGASDINISATSRHEVLLERFEASLNQSSVAIQHADRYTGRNGVTYAFTNVKPRIVNMTGLSKVATELSIERDVRFPHYVINITVDNEAAAYTDTESFLHGLPGRDAAGVDMPAAWYILDVFGTIVATNGKKVGDHAVQFDLTRSKTYYVTVKDPFYRTWMANLVPSGACRPDWECGGWTYCSDLEQTRDCRKTNACSNYVFEPRERRSCQTPSIDTVTLVGGFDDPAFEVVLGANGFGTLQLVDETGDVLNETSLGREAMQARIGIPDDAGVLQGGRYRIRLVADGAVKAERFLRYEGPVFTMRDIGLDYNVSRSGELRVWNVTGTVGNIGDTVGRVELDYSIGSIGPRSFQTPQVVQAGESATAVASTSLRARPGTYNLTVRASRGGEVAAQQELPMTLRYPEIELENVSLSYTYFNDRDQISVDRIAVDIRNRDSVNGMVHLEYRIGATAWEPLQDVAVAVPPGSSEAGSTVSFTGDPGTYDVHVRATIDDEVQATATRTFTMNAGS